MSFWIKKLIFNDIERSTMFTFLAMPVPGPEALFNLQGATTCNDIMTLVVSF
jgi:hypothetical protein